MPMEKKKKDQYKTYKSKSNNEYLYLLRTGKYGKVGITGNLYKRLMQYRSHNPLCDLIAYGNMNMIRGNNEMFQILDDEFDELFGVSRIYNEISRGENARIEKMLHKYAEYEIYDLDWVSYKSVSNYAIHLISAAGGFIDEVGVPLKMFFKNPTLFLPETKIQIIE